MKMLRLSVGVSRMDNITLEREGRDSLDICRREMVTLLDKGD